jgi:hypothetical protein
MTQTGTQKRSAKILCRYCFVHHKSYINCVTVSSTCSAPLGSATVARRKHGSFSGNIREE